VRRSPIGLTFLAAGRGRRTSTLPVLAIVVCLTSSVVAGGVSAASPAKADMAVSSISDGPDPVLTGQNVTYDVVVENLGPGQATDVTLTTTLPAGVSPVGLGSNCADAGGVVTCSWSSLPASVGAVELIIVTAPPTPGLLQLTFTVTAAERDPDLSNNSQTETTTVVQPTEADLSLNLPDSVAGYAGQNFIWLTVGVGNAGPALATGVTVTLLFPPGLSPGYGGGVCTETGSGLSCRYSLGSLGTGPVVAFQIGVLASAAGSYTVQGSVTADQPDPVLSNNSDSTLVTVTPAADLSAQIVGSPNPATPGAAITYAVTVTNHGPSPASTVALTDAWSSTVAGGVQLLSFGTTQGQCALSTDQRIDCQLGGLASGATTTVSVTVRARGTGSVTDQAQVSAAEFDPDTTNNAGTLTTTVGQA
jgi:uncharacterized repeat protein (TIGR01451 family)